MFFRNLDQVDSLGGMMSYNPEFLLIDILIIIHFFFMWYLSYKKSGWMIDLWHYTIFMSIFLSVFIQYPFISSPLNVFALGSRWTNVASFAESVLVLNILGYICMYAGRYLYDLFAGEIAFKLNPLEKIIANNAQSSFVIRVMALLTLAFIGVFIILQIQMGILFNPRAFFLENNTLRPLFNGLSGLLHILTTYFILRVFDYKKKIDITVCVLLIISNSFMGARSAIIGALLTCLIWYIYKRRGRINLIKFTGIVSGIFIVLLVATTLRGDMSNDGIPLSSIISFFLFYGNSFSDLRDGAFFFSCYDGDFLYGKTYLAALMSFVPRFLSDFREMWSLGVVTATAAGFNPIEHPGLRISTFGEMFLNFGYFGVMLLGIMYGWFLRKYDCLLKYAMDRGMLLTSTYSKIFIFTAIISLFTSSAGFFGFYVFLIMNFIIYLIRLIIRYLNSPL